MESLSDIQLAKAQGQLYQQFMQIQGNLIAVNREIERREPAKEDKPKE